MAEFGNLVQAESVYIVFAETDQTFRAIFKLPSQITAGVTSEKNRN